MTRTRKVVYTATLWSILVITGILLKMHGRASAGAYGALLGAGIAITVLILDDYW